MGHPALFFTGREKKDGAPRGRTVFVGRTLLSVAFDLDLGLKPKTGTGWQSEIKTKVKGDGQECPSHIFFAHFFNDGSIHSQG